MSRHLRPSELREKKFIDFHYTLTIDISKWKPKDRTTGNIKKLHDEIHTLFGRLLAKEVSDESVYMRDCATGRFKGSASVSKDILKRIMDGKSRYIMVESCYECPHCEVWPKFTPTCIETGKLIYRPRKIPRWCPLPTFQKLTGWE